MHPLCLALSWQESGALLPTLEVSSLDLPPLGFLRGGAACGARRSCSNCRAQLVSTWSLGLDFSDPNALKSHQLLAPLLPLSQPLLPGSPQPLSFSQSPPALAPFS